MVPGGLTWLRGFCDSTALALGQTLSYHVRAGSNPITYVVKLSWQEKVSGALQMRIWNLFQTWAAKNETVPQGKVDVDGSTMIIRVILKRRLSQNDNHPLGSG